jgi:hypothetical protein
MKRTFFAIFGAVLVTAAFFAACDSAGDDDNTTPVIDVGDLPKFDGAAPATKAAAETLVKEAVEAVVESLSGLSLGANTRTDSELFTPIHWDETITDIDGATGTLKADVTGTATFDPEKAEPKTGDSATITGTGALNLVFKDAKVGKTSAGKDLKLNGTFTESLSGNGKITFTEISDDAQKVGVKGTINETGGYGLSVSDGTTGLKLVYTATIKLSVDTNVDLADPSGMEGIADEVKSEFSASYKVYDNDNKELTEFGRTFKDYGEVLEFLGVDPGAFIPEDFAGAPAEDDDQTPLTNGGDDDTQDVSVPLPRLARALLGK